MEDDARFLDNVPTIICSLFEGIIHFLVAFTDCTLRDVDKKLSFEKSSYRVGRRYCHEY